MGLSRIIDDIDSQILAVLQDNARTPNAEIARRVGMAPSAIFERLRKLEEQGVIRAYEARLDPHVLGLDTLAFVLVRVDERLGESSSGERLKDIPGVLEVHHIAGEDCYLLKVRTEDTEALGRLLRERIGAIDSVRSTRTTIVLGTVKESAGLPIEGRMTPPAEASPRRGTEPRETSLVGPPRDGAGRRQARRRTPGSPGRSATSSPGRSPTSSPGRSPMSSPGRPATSSPDRSPTSKRVLP
jgi:Lrp/AsnC family leucine-responsive transcriptional regulator